MVPGAAPQRPASTTTARPAPYQRVDEAGRLAVEHLHLHAPADGQERPQPFGDRRPHAVIAPERVADPDHHRRAGMGRRRHPSWRVKSRKCVAHEMQGS